MAYFSFKTKCLFISLHMMIKVYVKNVRSNTYNLAFKHASSHVQCECVFSCAECYGVARSDGTSNAVES